MPPGMHPFVDSAVMARRASAADRAARTQPDRPDEHLFLRIAMASLPLIGLVLGVVGMALWTAH